MINHRELGCNHSMVKSLGTDDVNNPESNNIDKLT